MFARFFWWWFPMSRQLVRAQPRDLGLQFHDAFVALGKRRLDIRCFETLRDVLWAIRVPSQHREQDHLLWPRSVVLGHQSFDELVIAFDHSGFPPNFHPFPMRVIDEEQMRLCVVAEITLSDVLAVTSKIDKGDGALVEHTQESCGTAAMLDVGLALDVNSGEEDAYLCLDEGLKVRRDLCAPAPLFFHSFIGHPRTLADLQCLDGRREGDVARKGLSRVHGRLLKGRACWRQT